MRILPLACLAPMVLAVAGCNRAPEPASAEPAKTTAAPATMSDAELLAQGEYMVKMGGCNDCHTPGYNEVGGELPTDRWLVGSTEGFVGPWGTTFPANLRLKAAEMDEAAWLKYTGELHTRPIMPDFILRAMKETDRRAIYRFIRSLGTAGQPAPAYLPPGQKPQPPYWELVLPPSPPAAAPAAG